jgi:hypothetical protein
MIQRKWKLGSSIGLRQWHAQSNYAADGVEESGSLLTYMLLQAGLNVAEVEESVYMVSRSVSYYWGGGASTSCYRSSRTDHCICKTSEREMIGGNMEQAVCNRSFSKIIRSLSFLAGCLCVAKRLPQRCLFSLSRVVLTELCKSMGRFA